MKFMILNYLFFPLTGAVFDENTKKILVVQDRNKVSCLCFINCILNV